MARLVRRIWGHLFLAPLRVEAVCLMSDCEWGEKRGEGGNDSQGAVMQRG